MENNLLLEPVILLALFLVFFLAVQGSALLLLRAGFLTGAVDGALLRAALLESCIRGALPPVDMRADRPAPLFPLFML